MQRGLRTNVLKVVVAIGFVIIIFKLFYIQIIKHDHYVEEAAKLQTTQYTIVAERGEIYLMDGNEPVIAAMNAKVWTVILDPQTSKYDRENVEAKIDEYAKDYITAKWEDVFASNILRYYVVAKNVPYQVAHKIQEAELPGVWMQATTKRVYPEGTLASNVLGFVNADGVGQYGTEGAFNETLAGKNGLLKTVKDVNDIPLTIGDSNIKLPATDGSNVVLTIDRNVQNQVEKVLKKVTKDTGYKNATAVVMDPRNGEILAMAQTPSYDPANYGNVETAEVYQTDALTGLFEPASVCKTFAFAAAINEGKMTPETTYYNSDQTIVDGWEINNATKGHTGTITMQTALTWSLNTGSVQALRLLGDNPREITQVGKDRLFDYYYKRLRLGQYTGIGFREADGLVWAPDDINSTNARYANMTFGQGLSVTPTQVLAAFATVVNGGTYYRPSLYAGEMKNGKFEQVEYPEGDPGMITEKTSATMREMLYTARNLYINAKTFDAGAYVGGKTGTAQAIDSETGGYSLEGESIASYVGFGAKTKDDLPEYVVVTKIWEKGKNIGSGESKLLFDLISQWMIKYKKWK